MAQPPPRRRRPTAGAPARPAGSPSAGAPRPQPARPAAPAGAPRRPPVAAAPPDPLIGQVLGRCLIEARIGQGRTAVVYRARHQALDATVAVKVLTPAAAAIAEIRESFTTEARAIAKIDNENVIKVYDVGEEQGRHFLVMELLEGESILDLIEREGPMEVMDALRVARQSASGLAAAHGRGIMHRDVKPQNLVLLEDGTVKVVDFGLAAAEEAGTKRVGTPHYMAPEVCESAQGSSKSDIYSLGITLFHTLTGKVPFAGQDVPSILRSHVKGEPLRPERLRPGLRTDVGDLVRLLTRRDPAARPEATEVLEQIDAIGGKDVARKDTLRHRKGRARRREEARKSGALVLTLGLAVLLGAAAFLVLRSSDEPQPSPTKASNGPAPTPTPSTPAPARPAPTVPPPESAEAKAAREKREEDERRQRQAADALAEVETFARQTWKTKDDTSAVLERYRRMKDAYGGTKAAAEAEVRMKEIRSGKRHPHPDKTFSTADQVASALESWQRVKGEVEGLVAAHDYVTADGMLPPQVEDATGTAGREIAAWHRFLGDLIRFQNAFVREVPKLPLEQRRLTLPDGEVSIVRVSEREIDVSAGGTKRTLKWREVPVAEIARLATVAFADKGTETFLWRMAFAYAHRLREPFFEASLEMDLASDAGPFLDAAKTYKADFDAREAQAPKGQ